MDFGIPPPPFSLRVAPVGPVGDDGGVPPPLGVADDVRPNRMAVRSLDMAGGASPPTCVVGDVRSDKTDDVSSQRILRLDPSATSG